MTAKASSPITPTSPSRQEQEVAFKKRPFVPKKEVLKCKPGTWLQVMWLDSPDSVVLLLERVDRNARGDVAMRCYTPGLGAVNHRVDTRQVNRILGPVLVPEPVLTPQ